MSMQRSRMLVCFELRNRLAINVAKCAHPALTKQPGPRHPCLGRSRRLAPVAPNRRREPLPKSAGNLVFRVRASRNRLDNGLHEPAQVRKIATVGFQQRFVRKQRFNLRHVFELILLRVKHAPAFCDFTTGPSIGNGWLHGYDQMEVVRHHGIAQHRASKDFAQFLDALGNPMLAVIDVAIDVSVKSEQPRPAHSASHAMVGSGLVWAYVGAAGLGHKATISIEIDVWCQKKPYVRVSRI
jgi:hypothetical protein